MKHVALITGAAKGHGKEIAKKLIQANYSVALLDNDESVLEETTKEFSQIGNVYAETVDVSNYKSVEKVINNITNHFGYLHVVVNNAGITQNTGLLDMSMDEWHRVIAVNLTGVFIVTKLSLPKMIEQKFGRIINLSSVAAFAGGGAIGTSHYASSKAGVIGLTRAIAKEFGSYGITANAIAPGVSRTPMTEALLEKKEKEIIQTICVKRIGTSQDIANAVLFLSSVDAGFITGHCLVVDGGRGMGSRPFI